MSNAPQGTTVCVNHSLRRMRLRSIKARLVGSSAEWEHLCDRFPPSFVLEQPKAVQIALTRLVPPPLVPGPSLNPVFIPFAGLNPWGWVTRFHVQAVIDWIGVVSVQRRAMGWSRHTLAVSDRSRPALKCTLSMMAPDEPAPSESYLGVEWCE